MRLIAPALAIFAGALASRLLLHAAPSSIAVDLAQPLAVATNWHAFGFVTWLLLACTLGVAGIAYADVMRERPKRAQTLPFVLAASAIALVAGFYFIPLFSSDVYAYAAYGEMARTGLNPYTSTTLPKDNPL